MKRFQFPLERVLRYRELQAEVERAKLEVELTRLGDIDARIATLDLEGRRSEDAVRRHFDAPGDIRTSEMVTYPGFRSLLARARHHLVEERRGCLEAVDRQRAAVVEAARALEILERARAQDFERWRFAHIREGDATAGELFLCQWKPRRR